MIRRRGIVLVVRLALSAFLCAFVAAVILHGSPLSEVIHIDLYPIYLPVQGREQHPPIVEWVSLAFILLVCG